MSNEQIVEYWHTSAIETKDIADESYKNKHYNWSFFQWHLAIEKMLKGLIAKQGDVPLPIHDLVKLAKKSHLMITKNQRDILDEISTYNIDARYDDYKRNFYKKVSKSEYHKRWHAFCKEMFLWLEGKY